MSIQESLNNLTYEQEGILRYIKSKHYVSAVENHAINDTLNIVENLKKRAFGIESEIEEEIRRGYNKGYEEGKKEFVTRFSNLLEDLSRLSQKQAEVDKERLQELFQRFLSKLATVLPEKNISFIEAYIQKFIDEYSSSYRIQILVSEEIFKLLGEAGSTIFERAEILSNPDLRPEQIFIQYNGVLSEAGIDRFFEEFFR